jgi:hypothetical protein
LENLLSANIVDKMQFGPPKGFLDVSADMRVTKKENGGVKKVVVIIAKMP